MWKGYLPKKIAQLHLPAKRKQRLYYYLFLIICALPPGPQHKDDDGTAVSLAKSRQAVTFAFLMP